MCNLYSKRFNVKVVTQKSDLIEFTFEEQVLDELIAK